MKNSNNEMTKFSLRMTKELSNRLRIVAFKREETKTALIIRAIEKELAELEKDI